MERLRTHPEEASVDEFELLDKSRVFVGFTAPMRGEDELIGRIWTLREVTQERELDRLKDEFVATVSHELRTPLTSMMGFLEMLREGEAGDLLPEQERFLSIVHRSSERLQRLVGDLLFVSSFTSRMPFHSTRSWPRRWRRPVPTRAPTTCTCSSSRTEPSQCVAIVSGWASSSPT
jgi:signal transduction histidine kinase